MNHESILACFASDSNVDIIVTTVEQVSFDKWYALLNFVNARGGIPYFDESDPVLQDSLIIELKNKFYIMLANKV